jgi:PAS domain S-box/PAS domain S-box
LRQSEEKYRTIIENIEDGYFEVDLAGTFTFVNDAQCRNVGTPREQLLGKNNRDYTSEEEAKKLYQLFSGIYRTGEPVKGFAFEYKKRDGTMAFTELSVSLIRDAEGKPIGFRGISRDITERKQAEEALRKSEANYRQLFDNSPTGIYQIDFRTGKFLKANDLICEYLGCSQEEITSLSPYDFITKESQELLLERLSKMAIGDKIPEDPEYEVIDKNGKHRWLKLNSKNIYDSEGLLGADVVAHDITERKQAEEALRESDTLPSTCR